MELLELDGEILAGNGHLGPPRSSAAEWGQPAGIVNLPLHRGPLAVSVDTFPPSRFLG